ncbi:hypothetical protein PsorP6_002236 [Peronosclerospora sorghi]|uniref:Uncharacterized protein n=1 Tax=Peronosclerospora sorghi TaxID=230839 RepID=A0ACC0WS16_9STRA|nr:hypothetical protein PsorP6_002236 [Peronosclerospora sorghi]
MSSKTKTISGMQQRAVSNRAHNRMVLKKLLGFSILMVVVPLSTFYCVHNLFPRNVYSLLLLNVVDYVCSDLSGSQYADAWRLALEYAEIFGAAAVLSVNIIIGLYILSAWKENDEKIVLPPVGRFKKTKEL